MSPRRPSPPSRRPPSGTGRSSPGVERFFSERLHPDHDRAEFTCSNAELDAWFRSHALRADRGGTGRTYVWIDPTGAVSAYYTLAPHLVDRERLPKRAARGSMDVIPSILLARLALAVHLQGRGLGSILLFDAVERALEAIQVVGGQLIIVDAIDEDAEAFYSHHGFFRLASTAPRLAIKASDASQTFAKRS